AAAKRIARISCKHECVAAPEERRLEVRREARFELVPMPLRGSAAGAAHMSSAVWQKYEPVWRQPRWIACAVAGGFTLICSAPELHTAFLQSRFFPLLASHLTWQVEPGESPSIRYPDAGPFDVSRGYTRIPDFQTRLEQRGFRLAEQARFSPSLIFASK